jgi:hypothetical protein
MPLVSKSRRRTQQLLGPDPLQWPIEAKLQFLDYLRSLDKPGEEFKRTYRNNYVAFAHDCIDWRGEQPTAYQDEIWDAIPREHRVAVRGPHGLGKTCLAAISLLCFATTWDGDDWKAPTTASAWRQLTEFFWPEVHKWSQRVKWEKVGRPAFTQLELQTTLLKLTTGRAFAMASSDDELTEGAHADHLIYIFDEAKMIPAGRWDAAEGALMTGDCVLGSAVVSAAAPELATRRWHKGKVLKIETVRGHSLTVTPNHPILTARGWTRAKLLQPADQVVSCRDAESLMMLVEPNSVQIPAQIKDVFELYGIGNSSLKRAPAVLASENFNSAIPDSQIDVKSADGLLGRRYDTVLDEKPVDLSFVNGANTPSFLSRLSSLQELSFRFPLTLSGPSAISRAQRSLIRVTANIDTLRDGYPSTLNTPLVQTFSNNATGNSMFAGQFPDGKPVTEILDKQFMIRRKPLGVTAPHSPRLDAVTSQVVKNGSAADAKFFSQLNSIAPGNVFLDQVVSLTWTEFEGHVYDLQTATHWFTAEDCSTHSPSKGGIVVHNCYALAISTPGEPQGRFFDIHTKKPGYENWWCRHVTIEEVIAAGRITRQQVDQLARQWGENSAVFKSSEDCVIPLAWIEAANDRWRERIRLKSPHWNWIDGAKHNEWPAWEWVSAGAAEELTALGVDVSRSDNGDKTCLARRQGETVTQLDRMAVADTMPIVGRVKGLLERWTRAYAQVDVIGIGSGPVDRLRELFPAARIQAFNASEGTTIKDRAKELEFVNKRSAAWWNMRELLDPAFDSTIALPPCDLLTGDLTAPRRGKDTSTGKITVESKKDIRKRLGRSTDDGDAVVMAFFPKRREPVDDDSYSTSYYEYA